MPDKAFLTGLLTGHYFQRYTVPSTQNDYVLVQNTNNILCEMENIVLLLF